MYAIQTYSVHELLTNLRIILFSIIKFKKKHKYSVFFSFTYLEEIGLEIIGWKKKCYI